MATVCALESSSFCCVLAQFTRRDETFGRPRKRENNTTNTHKHLLTPWLTTTTTTRALRIPLLSEKKSVYSYINPPTVLWEYTQRRRERRCARRMAISALCPVQNISSLVFFLEFKKRRERKEREEEEERHTHAHKKRALIFEKEKKRGATLGPIFHFLFFSLLFFGESKSLFFFAFVKTSFLTNLRQQRWKKNNDTLFCERCFCLSFSPKSSLLKLSLQRRRQRRRRRKRATNAFFCLVILFDSDCVRILYISRRAEETYTHRERAGKFQSESRISHHQRSNIHLRANTHTKCETRT